MIHGTKKSMRHTLGKPAQLATTDGDGGEAGAALSPLAGAVVRLRFGIDGSEHDVATADPEMLARVKQYSQVIFPKYSRTSHCCAAVSALRAKPNALITRFFTYKNRCRDNARHQTSSKTSACHGLAD